ncbi:hypothetical protein QWY93_02875 [Echinicola jeungdonensis]|uniref:Uncharacterized protein n=1 Tax=Echinicola jeungdonensis TaxID=709343 RepID=A0ABV5J0T1_9BACT|nr:hypothetical protein [Echinicola jeungdonensis]MDN3668271.1 hypothetical protein [Echinicola jeungdonensis]
MKTFFLVFISFLLFNSAFAQMNVPEKEVPIYEFGKPVEDFETNFENLFHNWTTENVTNADDFQLLKYELVETINDEKAYQVYRNYFSGRKAVFSSTSGSSGGHIDSTGQLVEYSELYIEPGYRGHEIIDYSRLPDKLQKALNKEFIQELEEVKSKPLSIDSLDLNYYSYSFSKTDTVVDNDKFNDFNTVGIIHSHYGQEVYTTGKLSQNFMDVKIKKRKRITDLDVEEIRDLILEEEKTRRIGYQVRFNEKVSMGDKVYVVIFRYKNNLFSNYVICDSESKKVVMDYLFKSIEVTV